MTNTMNIDVSDKVLICGGGVGGLALGVALAKVGIPALIVERGKEIRSAGAGIRLQTNAWHALEQLGVAQRLREQHLRQTSIEVRRNTGLLLGSATYTEEEENRGVVRNELVLALADALPKGCLYLGCNVVDIAIDDCGNGIATLSNGQVLQPKLLIGADGVNSKVTKALGLASTAYSGHVGIRAIARFEEGVPELDTVTKVILGGPEGSFDLLFPLTRQTQYYASVFVLPEDQAKDFHNDKALAYLKENSKHIHPMFKVPLWVDNIRPEEIYAHQLMDRVPIKDKPWGKGCVTLMGDAAHPTTPFLGQGGAMALEDSVELAVALQKLLKSCAVSFKDVPSVLLEKALREYELIRAPRTHAMVALARYNVNLVCRKRTWLGVWIRDWWIRIASYFTRVTFYTVWDTKLY